MLYLELENCEYALVQVNGMKFALFLPGLQPWDGQFLRDPILQ